MRCWEVGGGGSINVFYCSQKKHLQINLRAEHGGFSPTGYSWAPAKLIIHPMNIAGIDDQVLLFRVQSEHSLPPGRTETSEALNKLPSCGEAWFKVKGWHRWAHSVLLLLSFIALLLLRMEGHALYIFFKIILLLWRPIYYSTKEISSTINIVKKRTFESYQGKWSTNVYSCKDTLCSHQL